MLIQRLGFGLTLFLMIGIAAFGVGLVGLRNQISSYAAHWREGSDDGSYVYVVIGDSTAQGIGASRPNRGYAGILADRIEEKTGKTVRVVNVSSSGAKVQDAIKAQLPQLRDVKPHLVTVAIGANDMEDFDPVRFSADFDELARQLPAGTVVADLPYFGGRVRHNDRALEASRIVRDIAVKYKLPLAELQHETSSRQSPFNYSVDYFHPSDRGYRIWADAFWTAVEPRLPSQ
jgi:acyl-CoA thioesterase-1